MGTSEQSDSITSIIDTNCIDHVFKQVQSGHAQVDGFLRDGSTLLTSCVLQGRISLVRAQQEELDADINRGDRNGWTPQYVSCYCGDQEMVRYQLELGADQSRQSNDKSEAQYIASREGHQDIIRLLVQYGSVNIQNIDQYGRSAQWIAVSNGHLSVVKYLVGLGCDLQVRDIEGYSLTLCAVQQGHCSILQYQVDDCEQRQEDVYNEESGKYDQFILDGWGYLHIACKVGHLCIVEYIYKLKPHLQNIPTMHTGKTPLCIAAEEGHVALVSVLLSFGANMNISTPEIGTCQHIACLKGHLDVVKLQCKQNQMHLEQPDKYNRTPQHLAVYSGHYEIAKYLLEQGQDPNMQTRLGKTALYQACRRFHVHIAELQLHYGASVDAPTKDGCSPLVYAARIGHTPLVKLLLRNSDSQYLQKDERPLLTAQKYSHFDVARVLQQRGASGQEGEERGILYDVVKSGHLELTLLLLSYHADPNQSKENDKTPLQLATTQANTAIVSCQLRAKANTEVYNRYGKTPLALAVQEGLY